MVEEIIQLKVRYCRIIFYYRVSGGYTGNFRFDSYDLSDSYEWAQFIAFMNIPEKYFESFEALNNFIYSLFGGEGAITDLSISEVDRVDISPKWYNHT